MSAGTQPAIAWWTPPPRQLVMAYSVCRGITRSSAKNFYYAFLVLPRRKREALCAVYAFMRRCDDIADDATLALQDRRQKLDTWLAALHRAQQGEPTDDAILPPLTLSPAPPPPPDCSTSSPSALLWILKTES